MNSVNDSNRLPAQLTLYLAVLPRQMVRIVENQAGRFEADAVLALVDPILSFIPGEFHDSPCIDEYV